MLTRIWDTARWLAFAFVVLVLAELANEIGPLREVRAHFDQHPQPWLGVTIASAGLGWGLLILVWALIIFGSGRSHPRRRSPSAHQRRSAPTPRLIGNAASFGEISDAFRHGEWLSDPSIRPYCIGLIGLVLAMVGMFGFAIVQGPPAAILVCSAALLYALGRLGWALARA
jgi:hypothetical protein